MAGIAVYSNAMLPNERTFPKACVNFCLILVVLKGAMTLSIAQTPEVRTEPTTPAIAAPRDVAFPGVMQIQVDATDVARRIFDVQQNIPVERAGRLTLLYPKWIPGGHSPRGTIDMVGGLTISANGQAVPWTRDSVEMTAFHVEVPQGAKALDLRFKFLSAVEPKIGRIVMTPVMLNLQWLSTAFYPAGYYVSRIQVEPSVKLPDGWGFGCALETNAPSAGWTKFKRTSFDTLMDSPIFAGRYYQQFKLTAQGDVPVRLNLVADAPEFLEADPKHIEVHRQLVVQARKLFGSQHYDHYDFLVALSDTLGRIGLEHHRSSENRVAQNYFTEWDKSFVGRDLLAHEFTHSWNGKFRRGADLWTPDYHTPMRNSLLWVYEGQTQYWGDVLAARSGLMTRRQVLEALALTAAHYDLSRGREWRSVQDTTNDPILAGRKPLSWKSYQRSEDYYSEGQLIWLDADTLIREKTGDQKSLDDFARAFFGIEDGHLGPVTYQFEDVVKTLNTIVPHDWAAFLKSRAEGLSQRAPLDGLARGGYELVFTNAPTEFFKARDTRLKTSDFSYSLGFVVGTGGVLSDVTWGGPAYQAGLTEGVTLIAVNSEAYELDNLKSAIKRAARADASAIELLIKDGNIFRTVKIDYHDGLRYPALKRIPGTRARLDEILKARN